MTEKEDVEAAVGGEPVAKEMKQEEPTYDAKNASETTIQQEDEEHAASSNVDEETTKQPHPRRKRRIIIAVIVVVVLLIVITLAAVLTTDDPEQYTPDPTYLTILSEMNITTSSSDAELEQAMATLSDYFLSTCAAGISMGVARNDTRVIVSRGVLNIDEDPLRLVTQDTLFEIGSVSKPITGLVLAHEIVTGNLTLNTTMNELLPDSVPDLIVNGEFVTLRHLVTHTSGFPRLPKNIAESSYFSFDEPNPYAGFSEEDMLREISIAASDLSNGEWSYSNFAFSTLAYLIGRSRNASFPSLQNELTTRLGLNDTGIGSPANGTSRQENLSAGYRTYGEVPYWYDGGLFIDGAGSTLSSTRDLLSLAEVFMSPEVKLKGDPDLREAVQLALEPLETVVTTPLRRNIAFGWITGDTPPWYAHTGGTAGFSTYLNFQPETRTAIVAITNCADSDIISLADALFSKLFRIDAS
ncbi:MAG: hypothetical protein SGILL_005481 [Bacillariaceae sp.]